MYMIKQETREMAQEKEDKRGKIEKKLSWPRKLGECEFVVCPRGVFSSKGKLDNQAVCNKSVFLCDFIREQKSEAKK